MAARRAVLLSRPAEPAAICFRPKRWRRRWRERGIAVDLATDARAARYGGAFPPRSVHVIPSATVRGRDPLSLAQTGGHARLRHAARRWLLLPRLKPAAVVGFGGYPTVPPLLAASCAACRP